MKNFALSIRLLAFCLLSLSLIQVHSQNYQTIDIVAAKDTNIKKKKDDENFGSCTELFVDRETNDLMRALFQFDLSSIPTTAMIQYAELRLDCTDGKDLNSIDVFRIGPGESWDEGTGCGDVGESNWLYRTATDTWTNPGIIGDPGAGTTPEASFYDTELVGIHTWDITCLTSEWITGAYANNGLMVGCQDGGGDRKVTYRSREDTAGFKPTLRITYAIEMDNDFDGVHDIIDLDDDNDGILDTLEAGITVNAPLQNFDFETSDIATLDGGPTDVETETGVWIGDATNISDWNSLDTVNNYIEVWHNSHTSADDASGTAYAGNQWVQVNATTNNAIYQDVVSTPGDVLHWSFAHRKKTSYNGSTNEDVVRLLIGDAGGTMTSMGDFVSAADATWDIHYGTYTVPAGQTTTRLTFVGIGTASGDITDGNFVDNVQLSVAPTTALDTDGDNISDLLDLDSDNDGIPDVVEAGFAASSNGLGRIDLAIFTDANKNGVHDSCEGILPLDSDNDGIANYKDLDSDNDTRFDVDEAGTERYTLGVLTFENGDGDINGDGVGDGDETEAFRGTGSCGGYLFGDGILDIYDYGTGANEYGNLNQGSAPLYLKDEDADGIPDYIDLISNGTDFDISLTIYSDLDANNDGLIDDTLDSDDDGILDLFDTNDSTFGSPRDIDQKLTIHFDGRNDYIQEATSITDQWTEATLMGWIKIDPTAAGRQRLFGQDNFYIDITATKRLQVHANGNTTMYDSPIPLDHWTHIGASYSDTNQELKIYVNGAIVAQDAVAGTLNADTSLFTIAKDASFDSDYFKGCIDDVRLFDIALSDTFFRKQIYQEIQNNSGVVSGVEIPLYITEAVNDVVVQLNWANLSRYYRFDVVKDDISDDFSTNPVDVGSGAKMYNIKKFTTQNAPMPFETTGSGLLSTTLNDAQKGLYGTDIETADWSIVRVKHTDVYIENHQFFVGLLVDETDENSNPITFTVNNDSELNISAYLKLDGLIDLEGESQLVQGMDSKLDVGMAGALEVEQQGTADTYTYNYWSSPVGVIDIGENNYSFTVQDVMFDDSMPVNFNSNGYNGANTNPVTIADYWIWKYANNPSSTYSAWQHVRRTGTIQSGEGFTMKGPGSGEITDDFSYVFNGKPNNGDVNLPIDAGNDYLIGNPYPSAIDANEFILDNGPNHDGAGGAPLINGALYFWEHWGGGTHNLTSYQGGYATYNLSGGTAAVSYGVIDPNFSTGGTPNKIPGRYVPISQGFFVVGQSSGDLKFNNSQRIFEKEGANSVFMRSSDNNTVATNPNEDLRPKLRFSFYSNEPLRRQLLLTIDEVATADVDWGYDAEINDPQTDDMFWMINDKKYVIQASNELDGGVIYPLGINASSDGTKTVSLYQFDNLPDDIEIYLHDSLLMNYTDLKSTDFEIFLTAGEYLDRFQIVLSRESENLLNITEADNTSTDIMYVSQSEEVILVNPSMIKIHSLELINVLGQSVLSVTDLRNSSHIVYPVSAISKGIYIVKIETEHGIISKKILVD